MTKCYFTSIRLYPTLFHVDVWICSDLDVIASHFNKRYGSSTEYYKEDLRNNSTQDIKPTKDSELKGDYTIVVNIDKLDFGVLIHELNHAYYHLCEIIGAKTNKESSEWHSYMLEYLFNECKSLDKFEIK